MALVKLSNDLYLGKFENEEDAEQYVSMMLRRYRHHPNPGKYSVEEMIKEAKRDGVTLNAPFIIRRLRKNNITVRRWPRNKKVNKKPALHTIDIALLDYLSGFENKSFLVELGLKLVTGWPVEEVVMFLPANHDIWSDKVTVIFQETDNGIKAQISGKIEHRDELLIRSLINKAQHLGLEYITAFCDTHGYTYLGGELTSTTKNKNEIDFLEVVDSDDYSVL
jgi:hypothetical protein